MNIEYTYELLGGPLHKQKKKILSRLNRADNRLAQVFVPLEDYYQFHYPKHRTLDELGTMGRAIYKVEYIQGSNQKIFPILIYSKWDVNDALDYLVHGVLRTDLREEP